MTAPARMDRAEEQAGSMAATTDNPSVPTEVPGRSHYNLDYVRSGRLHSFAHQMEAVLEFQPTSVLEVGVGTGVVAAGLRALGVQVRTLDLQPELHPDLVGSITAVPADDSAFDVVSCCQVLEHLPVDAVGEALKEIARVGHMGCVISVPDVTRDVALAWRLPLLGRGGFALSLPHDLPQQERVARFERMGHHWELGYAEMRPARFLDLARTAGLTLLRQWRVPELPWHRFYRFRRS